MLAIADRPKFPPVGRARELREHARRERARALSLIPRDEAPLTRANLKAIREADRHMAVVLALRLRVEAAAKDRSIVITLEERRAALHAGTEARRLLLAVERDLATRTQARYGDRVNAETKALEEAREEIVARQIVQVAAWRRHPDGRLVLVKGLPVLDFEDAQPLRITTRDGLEALAKKTPAQIKAGELPITAVGYAAGLRIRELYEKVDPERQLRPANLNPDARGGIHHGGDNWEEKRREISDQLARILTAVRLAGEDAGGANTGALWVRVVVEVACKGEPIGRVVKGSRARKRWRDALDPALDVVADQFGLH
jgi:hypothetical protein